MPARFFLAQNETSSLELKHDNAEQMTFSFQSVRAVSMHGATKCSVDALPITAHVEGSFWQSAARSCHRVYHCGKPKPAAKHSRYAVKAEELTKPGDVLEERLLGQCRCTASIRSNDNYPTGHTLAELRG